MTDTASAAPSEREQFEAHATERGYKLARGPNDSYQYRDAAVAWKAWQAARAQTTPPAVVEPRMPVGNATLERLREWERDGELRTAGDRYWGKPKERAAFECGVTWGFHKGQESAALTTAAAPCDSITDAEIDAIAEGMPGGIDGFLKGWGWRQFARAVLEYAALPEQSAAAPKAEPVPAGEYPPLQITAPNEEGATMCVVRWQVETPAGWVGSWDRDALEYLLGARAQAAVVKESLTAAHALPPGIARDDTVHGETYCTAAAPKAEPVPAGEYPPLPAPFIGVQDRPWGGHAEVIRSAIGEDGVVSCYTDEQMRAYVDADRAMLAQAAPAAAAATPTAASIAWTALRDLTDPLGEAGVKIMGHVRIYAQRQYEAGKEEADRAARAPVDSVTAPAYSIDADPQGIRARVADAITGALAFGAQGANPPPTGHWLVPFWETAREEASRNRPVSSDTLYLLRRLLSNQHTLTGSEFREELTKIVGEATQAADSVLEDAARYRWLRERSSTMFVNISINGEGAEIAATLDSTVDAARKQGGKP